MTFQAPFPLPPIYTQPLSPVGCTAIFTVATLLVAISAFGLLPLGLQLIFSITDYRHMTAMLISLNSHFYHISPQLETLQSALPHCPLTLLHVDLFFLNAFIVPNQKFLSPLSYSASLCCPLHLEGYLLSFLYLVPSRFQ